MHALPLNQLFKGFVNDAFDIAETAKSSGLAWDSRQVKKGDLFFACDGEMLHGKKFVKPAVKAGAVAIALETDDINEAYRLSRELDGCPVIPVADLTQKLGDIAARFYADPSRKMLIIGVTGTNGKTSVTHLLAQCLNSQREPCGVIGTMGAGLWGKLQNVQNTTPGAVELQQRLYDMYEQGGKYVAMEVSSHALAQGRTKGCDFDIAVFTNLTQDHLDYHGDMKSYGEAKLKLFTYSGLNQVVLNLDDNFSQTIIRSLPTGISVIGITLKSSQQHYSGIDVIVGSVIKANDQGMTIAVDSPFGCGEIKTKLLGDFNASNLLVVLACAVGLGLSVDDVCKRLAEIKAPAGRLEKFGGGNKPLVVVDYAHTPDALEKVLSTLKKQTAGKLFVMMGCGGDRDPLKRPEMGAVAEAYADVIYLTNDNPRTESPERIIDGILKGISNPALVIVELDRERAIRKVISQAKKTDVVLIAGKGHEEYQIVGDNRTHFSDRKIVAELLGEAA